MRLVKNFLIIFLMFFSCYVFADIKNEQRLALIIGNFDYEDSPLINPKNDSRDIANALKKLGFKVTFRQNVTRKQFRKEIRVFGDKLRKGGTGLFYYAGHGIQAKGVNYLVPVKADILREDEISDEAIEAGSVLRKMESARNRLNIVILDACRNNPFARSFRSGVKGLTRMDAPSGTIIAYATSPGSTASDGGEGERNSPYTKNLLNHMKTPGLSIEQVFKKVRIGVRRETENLQTPWESSSLTGDFYFIADNDSSTGVSRVSSSKRYENKIAKITTRPSETKRKPSSSRTSSRSVKWRRGTDGYYVFVDDEPIHYKDSVTASKMAQDHLVYDSETGKHYQLPKYYDQKKNSSARLKKGKEVYSPSKAFFTRGKNGYYLSYKGNGLHTKDTIKAFKTGDNHLVYDKETKKYFLLPNYYKLAKNNNNGLKKAVMPVTSNQTLWKRGPDGYYIFSKDEALHYKDSVTAFRMGEDHLVYDADDKKFFLCKNYYKKPKNHRQKFLSAKTIYNPNNTLWKRGPGGYVAFADGEALHKKDSIKAEKDGNDHILIDKDTGKKYIFKDYYRQKRTYANKLRPAVIIHDDLASNSVRKKKKAKPVYKKPTEKIKWRRGTDGYSLFVNGEELHYKDSVTAARMAQDHLVYDKESKKHYLLPKYYDQKKNDSTPLKNGKRVSSSTRAFYTRGKKGYSLTYEGEALHTKDSVKEFRSGENHLVYDKELRKYFLLKNYYKLPKNDNNGLLYPEIPYTSNLTLWKRGPDGYYFYSRGEALHHKDAVTAFRMGDDHLVYDGDKKKFYLCKNYYKKPKSHKTKFSIAKVIYNPNNTLWKRGPSGYLAFADGEALHKKDSVTAKKIGNDHILIDKEKNKKYTFKNYYKEKKSYSNKLKPAKISSLSSSSNERVASDDDEYSSPSSTSSKKVKWRRGTDGYYIFVDDEALHYKDSVSASKMDKDHLVYDSETGEHFLLPKYYSKNKTKSKKLMTGRQVTSPTGSFFTRGTDGYYLSYEGESLHTKDSVKAFKTGDNHLVYDKETRKYFLLKNYYKMKKGGNSIKPSEMPYSPNQTLWKRGPDGYYVFSKDEALHYKDSVKAFRMGDDHLVYDDEGKKFFLCKNYYKKSKGHNQKFSVTKKIYNPNNTLWKRGPSGYVAFAGGEALHKKKNVVAEKEGDDHILIDSDKGKKYVLKNYYRQKKSYSNKLRPAKIAY